MTNIEFTKDSFGNIIKFVMDGHTDYADGEDIVCAALSAVSYSTLNGMKNVLGIEFGYEVEDGYLYFVLPNQLEESVREKVNILLDTMYLFMIDLKEQHGDHVAVKVLEV